MHYLRGFSSLHVLDDAAERRASFRQSMAALAEAALEARGVPLEGLRPDHLLASVRAALAAGLLDDLGFLSPHGAACALYGLASALPHGPERRELGRRVLLRLHEGDAITFVTLATSVALGSSRAFDGPGMRARVNLSLALPIGAAAPVDGLALALISRRELAQRWLIEPAGGSLPARRMAARILERAAREAARRAVQGDDGAVWLFDAPHVQGAWNHLMLDREPLVWRHVATARGLLSAVVPRFAEEVERDLLTPQSLARGRRGAASLAARVAIRPSEAVGQARELLHGGALARDAGLAAAMIYGLPRAAEVEPDAAEALLETAVEKGGILAADALLELRREWYGTSFGAAAAERALTLLRQKYGHGGDDDGQAALIDLLCEELGEGGARPSSLSEAVFQALTAFADTSARTASDLARAAFDQAERAVAQLESLDETRGPGARREAFRLLHELDVTLLESSALSDLLGLGQVSQDLGRTPSPLAPLLGRLSSYALAGERAPYKGGESVPHLTWRMRRLRTLLHLLDGEAREVERTDAPGERLLAVHALFERVSRDAPSAMDRIVHAALSRGCDGLVRDEVFELSDVMLAAAQHVPTPEGFSTLSEGSMLPEVKSCSKALASLVRTLYKVKPDPLGQRALIEALSDLSRALPTDCSPRTEGLRASLLRLSRALRHVSAARSLRELSEERRPLELLELAVEELVQLAAGARRRLGFPGADAAPTSGHGVWALGLSLERCLEEGTVSSLELALETLGDSLRAELPPIFATVIARVLRPLLERPREPGLLSAPPSVVPELMEERPLPPWLPRARVLGDFYVLRALGAGAGGSVFAVKRLTERDDPRAHELALKVPEYDGSAARFLSEREFLTRFSREAGALFAVPPHANLAGFVAFDAAPRPRPLLVMELVKGPSLARVLAKGDLDTARALRILAGVLSGLECMHAVGVGHLGVKPDNVILREREGQAATPVLVDYGLSGRVVRPGCASGHYGAPELWQDQVECPAPPADLYAFGCLGFELLTGQRLFEADSEAQLIAEHLAHDGRPPKLVSLARDPGTLALAEWLSGCLRREPGERTQVAQLARELAALEAALEGRGWPLGLDDVVSY